MSKEKDPQNIASSLLIKICKVKKEKLIEAFDSTESYIIFRKKREGKKSLVVKEPKKVLKLVQKRLLFFLNKLKYRTDEYTRKYYDYDTKNKLAYKGVYSHLLSSKMYGQLPKTSLQDAVKFHLDRNSLFLVKMDLKNAYQSVKTKVLEETLLKIFLDECRAYYFAYKKVLEVRKYQQDLKNFIKNVDGIAQMVVEKIEDLYGDNLYDYNWQYRANTILKEMGFNFFSPYDALFKKDYFESNRKLRTLDFYPKAPFFPAVQFPEFRKMIRELAKEGREIEQSEIPEIIDFFTKYLVRLTTTHGSLPKGSPTSGMLLNIVISEAKMLQKIEWKKEKCSIYVDDIFITTDKKPDYKRIFSLIGKIEKAGIFKYNPKKVRVYDLRNKSGSVLGMKLVRRPTSFLEEEYLDACPKGYKPRGYQRAVRTERVWNTLAITLSKKKQNQYRGLLHKVTIKSFTEKEKDRALGYYGHIVSVYGWPIWKMPASLSKTVQAFREKFSINSASARTLGTESLQNILRIKRLEK